MSAAAAISLQDIVTHTARAQGIAAEKGRQMGAATNRLRILALNALIEAGRVGEAGRGFSVVADEVRKISSLFDELSGALQQDLGQEVGELESLTRRMAEEANGARLTDLALNAIELIDRNLYERTCDVRWWATDGSVLAAAGQPDAASCSHACHRLGVILSAYTVYLDIWLCDLDGRVLASGRPGRYAVAGERVAGRSWFQKARALASGDDYVAADIEIEPLLGGAEVATYAAGVREGGDPRGRLVGMLGVHFDWQPQARAIVEGTRLTQAERKTTRVLLVDARGRVIAASAGATGLKETLVLKTGSAPSGTYRDGSRLIAFHHTPGYETYAGLGWHGVIVQEGA